jgi:hypothetical protein
MANEMVVVEGRRKLGGWQMDSMVGLNGHV